ncbi:MAG: hypothetical protein IT235_03355, partial [Bacteroidia bacterium]|nr:hypothetical protein [Bacteroidia bacterium]
TNPGGTTYFDATFNTGSGLDDEFILKFVHTPVSVTQSQMNSNACNPCNGSATVTLNNMCPPYNFVWSNGSSSTNVTSNSNTINGLCAGTYSVSVSGSCNTQSLSANYIITGIDCNACNLKGQFTKGTANCSNCGCKEWIMVNATGGTSPYTYTWPDGYDKRYKNSLCPGAYNVKITDGNGCTVNLNINAP